MGFPKEKFKALVILLAAGGGRRFTSQNHTPKQFAKLCEQPMIIHPLRTMSLCDCVEQILIVAPLGWIHPVEELVIKNDLRKVLAVIPGDVTRQLSSYSGIKWLVEHDYPDDSLILIHDAARPFVTRDLIFSVAQAAAVNGAAIPIIPMTDTLIQKKHHGSLTYPERKDLFMVQTPQGFRLDIIFQAHLEAKKRGQTDALDDSSLVFYMGVKPAFTQGNAFNLKITFSDDIDYLQRITGYET